jgi:hypothetical protein
MKIISYFFSPFLNVLRHFVNGVEYERFKAAVRRNPNDTYLRARFAKYCLEQYFNHEDTQKATRWRVTEAVNNFENIVHDDVLDLEVFYLMGKYYQGVDNKKAAEVYRRGIRTYNDFVTKSQAFKHEYVEMAFSIALNLLALEPKGADPDLEKFFKTVRKTYLKGFLDQKVEFKPEEIGEPRPLN